jgi:hypothetical protein
LDGNGERELVERKEKEEENQGVVDPVGILRG